MRTALVFVHGELAATLIEHERGSKYILRYQSNYKGEPVSLILPVRSEPYAFDRFPPFLDGLLPEGAMLDALLRQKKIDRSDLFSQLLAVGADLVGAITVKEGNGKPE